MGNQSSQSPHSSVSRSRTTDKNRVYVSYFDPSRGVVDMSVPFSAAVKAKVVLRCLEEHQKQSTAGLVSHHWTSSKTPSRTANDELEFSDMKYMERQSSYQSSTESPR